MSRPIITNIYKRRTAFSDELLSIIADYPDQQIVIIDELLSKLNHIQLDELEDLIVNNYDTTIFVEEALYRLVELNYKLGLVNEAKKYTALLGYNYQSSEWYERSYKILNKEYKKPKIEKSFKEQKSLIKKFKDLFE